MKFGIFPKVVSLLFITFILLGNTQGFFKLKNLQCNCYDKFFCEFKTCELKVLGRGKVGLSSHVKVHQLPIKSSVWDITLFRRFNGYRPFLFNKSVDICHFFKHKKRYPFVNLMYEAYRNYSNVNHSCPYNHDLIISRMVLEDKMLNLIPVPNGIYKLSIKVHTEGVERGEIDLHSEVNLGFD